MHYTISRDDTASDHSRQERTLGEWAEKTRRRRLPLFPRGHDGSEAKHERIPVRDAALVENSGFLSTFSRGSLPKPFQPRAQSRTTALSSARQTHTLYSSEAYASRSEDEDGSQTSLTDEYDFYNDTTSLPGNNDNVNFDDERLSFSDKHEWGGEESATQANISSAEKPRGRQAVISYEKPSRDRRDDIIEFEMERLRREDRDRQREKLLTIREQLKAFKRISELASEEEIRQQESMPLQYDLPVPPVPPVPLKPPDFKTRMTETMIFAATYMDQSRKTGAINPRPGLNRPQTHDVRYVPPIPTPPAAAPYVIPPPPIPAEKDSSRRSSKTKKRKTPLLADVPETDSIAWQNE